MDEYNLNNRENIHLHVIHILIDKYLKLKQIRLFNALLLKSDFQYYFLFQIFQLSYIKVVIIYKPIAKYQVICDPYVFDI